jgi:hypothetical protein
MVRHGRKTAIAIQLGVALLALLPGIAFAQTGVIAGSVRDATGAVLPGVTVEASSPALIEKVKTVVTDGEGIYRIIDLRPGEYTVTFTLPGFSVVKREGVELPSGVTLTINADLRVGGLEETVTVSGQSPLVDVQSATQHHTVSRAQIEELPTGRQWFSYLALVPGVSRSTRGQDVGGSTGDQSQALSIHGSIGAEMSHNWDGMRWGNMFGTGGGTNGPYPLNNAMIQEIAVQSAGASAEADVAGVRTNLIPKQGGNRFTSYFFGNYTNDALQSNNLDDDLRDRGVATTTVTTKIWDINPAFGGPLKRDKVWFYGSFRYFGSTEQPTGAFYDTDPYDLVFTQDVNRGPAENPSWTRQVNLRVTGQLSQKHRLTFYGDDNDRCTPCAITLSSVRPWEATTRLVTPISRILQATWSWTVSNRLFVEVGETYKPDSWGFKRQDVVRDEYPAIVDSGTGVQFRAPTTAETHQISHQANGKFTVQYVTGSHNLKVGTQWFHGERERQFRTPGEKWYTFQGGVPVSVTTRATPFSAWETLKMNLGIFVQEQWTLRKITLNAGVRYDYLNLYIPEQHLAPVQYVGSRDFDATRDIPNWHDVSPRLGLSYDLFGNGKTAIKWNLGRYIEGQAGGFPEQVNPITQNATSTRTWNDANGNFIPDCDLANQAANGECLASNNQNFGRPVVPFRYDPRAATGWGTRGYNWETMAGIQHQLLPSLAVDVSYNRRWFGNFRVSDNVLVTSADHDQFCVTAPVDPRLPNSGQQICGLYDIKPTSFGRSDTVLTRASDFGKQTRIYDGVDVTANVRLPGGIAMQGGASTGRTKTNGCFVIDSPQALLFCDVRPPMEMQLKGSVVYPLPWWGLQTSAAYQSHPGPEITASWSAPASAVTGLGRSLSGGARTVTVPLVAPGTTYGERMNQIDFRVAKNIRTRRGRIQPQLDLYNMLNSNAVYGQNNVYGTAWLRPTQVLVGRMAKVGIQIDF